jgi:hypothetical protein
MARGMSLSDTSIVEFCLDGVVQSVRVGPDGGPVTPDVDCGQTHACCIMSANLALPGILPEVTALFLQEADASDWDGALISRNEYLFADPRGPPAAQIEQIEQTEIRS